MTAKREYMSWENAVDEAIYVLGGADCVGDISGNLKHGIARHWSNPNNRLLPNVENAYRVGQACLTAGHHRDPFLHKYIQMSLSEALPAIPAEPLEKIADLTIAVGEVAKVVKNAQCPNGPGGADHTSDEDDQILKSIHEARAELNALESSVKANQHPQLKVMS